MLAGGQSLMPAMNLRLISPEIVVDIGNLSELKGIGVRGSTLRIGALTNHAELLRSSEIATHAPLLAEAVAHVAHPAIRNRGTIGGSLAHADPAAELPASMLALDAAIVARGARGERRIAATAFFTGIFETALASDELLVAVELPIARKNSAYFFHEFARRHGDYAIAGLAAQAVIESGQLYRPSSCVFRTWRQAGLGECHRQACQRRGDARARRRGVGGPCRGTGPSRGPASLERNAPAPGEGAADARRHRAVEAPRACRGDA